MAQVESATAEERELLESGALFVNESGLGLGA